MPHVTTGGKPCFSISKASNKYKNIIDSSKHYKFCSLVNDTISEECHTESYKSKKKKNCSC